MSFRRLRTVIFCTTALLSGNAVAQDPHPGETGFAMPPMAQMQTAGHYGSSPYNPPEPDDSTFVVDRGPGLDTGCTFRSGGPLRFEILVDRAFENPGDLDALKKNGLVSEKAILRMPVYDIDFNGGGSSYAPERDRVYFNDQLVPEEYLTGANGVWKDNTFQIPIEWVKFREAADVAQAGMLRFLGLPGSVIVNALAGAAGIQLTTPYMALYNRMHGSSPQVRYTALAGSTILRADSAC